MKLLQVENIGLHKLTEMEEVMKKIDARNNASNHKTDLGVVYYQGKQFCKIPSLQNAT